MSTDSEENYKKDIAAAYSRGYVAGKKRKTSARTKENIEAQRNAFWRKAMVELLPYCIGPNRWTFGDEDITSAKDKVKLAASFADYALQQAVSKGRI